MRFEVSGRNYSQHIDFVPRRVALLGLTGTPQLNALHCAELAAAGIEPPEGQPGIMNFSVQSMKVSTASTLVTDSPSTSGEIEVVLLRHQGEWFVGVGSDHTDRRKQRDSTLAAKEACPKIISRHLWKGADIADQWRDLVMESVVVEGGKVQKYQKVKLSELLPYDDLVNFVTNNIKTDSDLEGSVVFCGTVATLGGFRFHQRFQGTLTNSRTNESITFGYTTSVIPQSGRVLRKSAVEFTPVSNFVWESIAPGLHQCVLSGDPRSNNFTRLLRLDPGTSTESSGSQRHEFWEEIYIIEGSQFDLALQTLQSAGSYACRPPGMIHGPWSSEQGCTLFEVRYTQS